MTEAADLYETDFVRWTEQQAQVLRASRDRGTNLPVDWTNLADEVDGLGNAVRAELVSRLATAVEHLLKLIHSPAVDPRAGWRSTIRRTRDDIAELLETSPSLRRDVPALVERVCSRTGRRVAADLIDRGEIDRDRSILLAAAHLTPEQVLGDWFPDDPAPS